MQITPVDETVLSSIPLKEMEASMLARFIVVEAFRAGLDVDLFEEAIAIAGYAHRAQTRAQRGSMPRVHYIEHPLRNTARLIRYGVRDQVTLLAEILHDTVEDNPQDLSMLGGLNPADEVEGRHGAAAFLSERFGDAVTQVVLAVTNPLLPKSTTKPERNRLYVEHVEELVKSARPALVKLGDYVDNASSLHHTVAPENRGKVVHLATKYEPLLPVFGRVLDSGLLDDLVPAQGRLVAHLHLATARQNIFDILHAPAVV